MYLENGPRNMLVARDVGKRGVEKIKLVLTIDPEISDVS